MARRISVSDVTVSANTAKTSAVSTDISFNPGPVTEIEIIIPDGHVGLTGIQLAQAGQAIIPEDGSTFIVGNDEVIRWPIDGFIDSGNWQAICYNTDIHNHSFHIRFLIDSNLANQQVSPLPTPLFV